MKLKKLKTIKNLKNNKIFNINNKKIVRCSSNPMTGFFRDGFCRTSKKDIGRHTVCALMDKNFLEYTKNKGNNLNSVVKSGEKWCLCESRWNEAFKDGYAPIVISKATNKNTNPKIIRNIKKHLNYLKA